MKFLPNFNKVHTYHVVYFFTQKDFQTGYGTITIEQNPKRIKDEEDIKRIEKWIKEKNNFKNVLILNWFKLKTLKKVKS